MKTEKNHFGCSIQDVDVNSITPEAIAELKEHLYKNRLIVLKNQVVSEQQYCDFANRFGFPVPYLQDNYHHPDFPLIFRLLQREERRQADRSRPYRRLLALGHVLREGTESSHDADAKGASP